MESIDHSFERLKVCILVPTFNNAKTLTALIRDLQVFNTEIFIVNDGSTDDTERILNLFPQIHMISYSPNRGKGFALRKGFRAAIEKGL
jgi:glycosyltransferase involved in cell wall biosynthesis